MRIKPLGSGMAIQPLTADERALLDLLLTAEFPGRDALVEQAKTASWGGPGCTCGCPSYLLEVDRTLPAALVEEPMVSDAHGRDRAGNLVGILLFVDEGYLREVEIYGHEDFEWAGLPILGSVELEDRVEVAPGTFRPREDV
jgi:hypothetical protein